MRRSVAFFALQRIRFWTANEKKRYFWMVPEPLVQQFKKKTVGALGTRMGRKCYTSALKTLPFNSVVVVEQFPAKPLVDAALASFPPQLHHSSWPDRAFPPTNKNRQLRRLVFLACVAPLYIVLSSYSVALLLCYSVTLLLCYPVTLLPCYSVTLLGSVTILGSVTLLPF